MNIIEEGYIYELENFDKKSFPQRINFVKKTKGEEVTKILVDGTINEELVKVVIDRLDFLNKQHYSRENVLAMEKLKESLYWMTERYVTKKKIRTKIQQTINEFND